MIKCSANDKDIRVAIYIRVSTLEQNTDNQSIELNKYCISRGRYTKMYIDKVSGCKESRPQFDIMLNDAHKRKFDIVLVWKLDRLSRSLKHLLNTLDLLNSLNIGFISYSDNFDTTTAQGKLMFSIVGAFAEFERSLIQERVKLGLKRAVANGAKLGRPKININKYHILHLRNEGRSLRDIGEQLKISYVTVRNIIKNGEMSELREL
jgi:DNA invertase Pin-like site-specific DNA recombinase